MANTMLLSSSYEGTRHRTRFLSLWELTDAVLTPLGRGAGQAAVHGVAKSRTALNN